jgi:hypothetical protein
MNDVLLHGAGASGDVLWGIGSNIGASSTATVRRLADGEWEQVEVKLPPSAELRAIATGERGRVRIGGTSTVGAFITGTDDDGADWFTADVPRSASEGGRLDAMLTTATGEWAAMNRLGAPGMALLRSRDGRTWEPTPTTYDRTGRVYALSECH